MAGPPSLRELLDLDQILDLAGERSYKRGLAYLHDGAVRKLKVRDGAVHATVEGSETYHERRKAKPSPWSHGPDRTSLVEIYLHLGDPEQAWQEALGGGCRSDLWARLADLRQYEHPEDAIRAWTALAELAIERKDNRG